MELPNIQDLLQLSSESEKKSTFDEKQEEFKKRQKRVI